MVRSRTWPSPGVGAAYSSMRKSEAFGSPTGRETRTTRFADWDMVFPPGFFAFRHCERSEAIHSCQRQRWIALSQELLAMTFDNSDDRRSGRNLGQRRLKRRCGTRQIRKRKPAIRGLFLTFRCGGANFRDRLFTLADGDR